MRQVEMLVMRVPYILLRGFASQTRHSPLEQLSDPAGKGRELNIVKRIGYSHMFRFWKWATELRC